MTRISVLSLSILMLLAAVLVSSPAVFADDAQNTSRQSFVDANEDGVCDLFDDAATQMRRNGSGKGDGKGIRDRKRDGSGDCPHGNDGIRDRKRDGSGNGKRDGSGHGKGKGKGRRGH
ncbi:MAG: hypothetical protein U5N86_00420 [Planctomycetota bacterium]|nr:hypothetical protein [Planctomycetota bacterium]